MTTQIDDAIAHLRAIIAAAENRNPSAAAAVVEAAAAGSLKRAVRLVLPEIRHSISAGDGRFTDNQVYMLESALAESRGATLVAA